jgi:hypothetical protein
MQVLSYYCKCLGILLVVSLATLWPRNVLAQSDSTKDYPTFHRNPQRTGWIPNETKLTPANVKGGQFGPLWNLTVGPAYTIRLHFVESAFKDICPLFLLKHLSTIGINEGNITGLLIPPHQIPDRRLKPVGVPKCKG